MKNALLIAMLLVCAACRERSAPEPPPAATTAAVSDTVTEPAPAPATAPETAPPAPAAPAPAPAVAGPKLRPVDEGAGDPALAAYRKELLAAVRARDVEKIVALSDPKIRTSFGGGSGADDLRRMLRDEKTVADLEQLLTLGGTFRGAGDQHSFWAPYVYSAWPDEHDPFESLAVIGENVPLRQSDAAGADTIATLSYDIVKRSNAPGTNVKTADGRSGWADPERLRSPVGYRAGFMQSGGRWRMNALVAGD